jgi:hypothetical protein
MHGGVQHTSACMSLCSAQRGWALLATLVVLLRTSASLPPVLPIVCPVLAAQAAVTPALRGVARAAHPSSAA